MAELDEEGSANVSIDVTPDQDEIVVTVGGELDISTAGVLEEAIFFDGRHDARRMVFDLSDVDFMDSSGIAVLLRAAAPTGWVEIRRPSTVVRLVVEATGLADVLRISE
ncbi:MAG TPA: STAS domain-containing protein [Ilumatobacteraceae bacterium]|jgi:anti-anti-sigma factor